MTKPFGTSSLLVTVYDLSLFGWYNDLVPGKSLIKFSCTYKKSLVSLLNTGLIFLGIYIIHGSYEFYIISHVFSTFHQTANSKIS